VYFSLIRMNMFKISVMTKAWKCPIFGSGHGQLLAFGIRNLLDSGTRELLALETGQLIAAGNRHLSASGTTDLLAYGTGSGLRDQLLACGTSYLLLEPVTHFWNQFPASEKLPSSGKSYPFLEQITRFWNQLVTSGTSYSLLEPVTCF
jgi:hypothetical protein